MMKIEVLYEDLERENGVEILISDYARLVQDGEAGIVLEVSDTSGVWTQVKFSGEGALISMKQGLDQEELER